MSVALSVQNLFSSGGVDRNYTEKGDFLASNVERAWTGSHLRGERTSFAPSGYCANWTSSSSVSPLPGDPNPQQSAFGDPNSTTGKWLNAGTSSGGISIAPCSQELRIYCLEQPGLPVLPSPTPTRSATPTATATSTSTTPADQRSYIFVTKDKYPPVFGGLDGGDQLCQTLAPADKQNLFWQAVLSDSNTDAIERFRHYTGQVRDLRENIISGSLPGMLIGGYLINSVIVTEKGDFVNSSAEQFGYAWSGTARSGRRPQSYENPVGNYCENWSSTSGITRVGQVGSYTETWLSLLYPPATLPALSCSNTHHLYCLGTVQRPFPTPTPTLTFTPTLTPTITLTPTATPTPTVTPTATSVPLGSRAYIFVSSQSYDGNLGGLAGADQKCANLAPENKANFTWKAVLSDTNTDAKDRFGDLNGTVGNLPLYDLNEKYITWMKDLFTSTQFSNTIKLTNNFTDTTASYAWGWTRYGGVREFINGNSNACFNWTRGAEGTYAPSASLGTIGTIGWYFIGIAPNSAPRFCNHYYPIYCLGIFDQPTPTPTSTATLVPVNTATLTPSPTSTLTNTATATRTSTQTPASTATLTSTPTRTPVNTTTPTLTSTNTAVATTTATPTSTSTPVSTPSATMTGVSVSTATPTLTAVSTQAPTNTATPSSSNALRVFVTSKSYSGNFASTKGVEEADRQCRQAAILKNLGGQDWKAFISGRNSFGKIETAKNRLLIPGKIVRLDGKVVADSAQLLFNGQIKRRININEHGALYNGRVWTGTNFSGSLASQHCKNWSATTNNNNMILFGGQGSSTSLNRGWYTSLNGFCSNQARLYCFEQSSPIQRNGARTSEDTLIEAVFASMKESVTFSRTKEGIAMQWKPFDAAFRPDSIRYTVYTETETWSETVNGNKNSIVVLSNNRYQESSKLVIELNAIFGDNKLKVPLGSFVFPDGKQALTAGVKADISASSADKTRFIVLNIDGKKVTYDLRTNKLDDPKLSLAHANNNGKTIAIDEGVSDFQSGEVKGNSHLSTDMLLTHQAENKLYGLTESYEFASYAGSGDTEILANLGFLRDITGSINSIAQYRDAKFYFGTDGGYLISLERKDSDSEVAVLHISEKRIVVMSEQSRSASTSK